jgi:hypothetical protein
MKNILNEIEIIKDLGERKNCFLYHQLMNLREEKKKRIDATVTARQEDKDKRER